MSARRRACAIVAAALAAVLLPGLSGAQEFGDLVVKKGKQRGDRWLAGGTVDVHGDVDGDVTAIGIQAGLDGTVTGDVNIAGLRVRVGGVVGDDARAVGAHVVVQGWVGDALLAAGGQVEVTRNTRIGGIALIAGRRVELLGDVHGDLYAAARSIELDGDLHGTVRIRSDDVTVGPRAHLFGDLVVHGRNPPHVAEGARIEGKVVQETPPAAGLAGFAVAVTRALILQVGMLLVAWAWLVLAPRLSAAAASPAPGRPGLPEAMGACAVAALPLGAILLAVTVIGLPLAIAVAAVWTLLVLASWSAAAVRLGGWVRGRLRPGAGPLGLAGRLGWTFVALLGLRAAAALPWAGWAATALALLAGAAAIGRATWDGLTARRGDREGG
jgi:cytoskeletal protein CcmA (bactofilin family)